MRRLFSKYKWLGILLGVLLIAGGILLAVMSAVNVSSLNLIFSITVAVILFLIGGSLLLSSLLTSADIIFGSDLIFGALYVTFGILILTNINLLPDMIINIIGIILIAYGTALLFKSIALVIKKYKKTGYIVLGFLVGAIAIAGGILTIIYSSAVQTIIYIGLGVAIACFGVMQIITTAKRK